MDRVEQTLGSVADTETTRAERAVTLVLATLLSVVFTGFIPFFNNNIYHLPILRADYDLPQFADDAFVQSLRHFSSGFWMVFSGSAAFMPPHLFMLGAFVISRLLFLISALSLASRFGYGRRRFSRIFLPLVAMTPLLRGTAPGGGGIAIDYFTHSELANATLLMSLSMLLARRYGLSVFLACVTFFINAFMAVWLAPLWLAGASVLIGKMQVKPRQMLTGCIAGAVAGIPLVIPVLQAIFAGENGGVVDYSYSAYLRDFFPFHFFINSLPNEEMLDLLQLCACILPVCALIRQSRLFFLALGLAAIALLGVGALVPMLTDERLILNLHLVRSAVLIQMLASLGLSMVGAGWVAGYGSSEDRTLGFILWALLLTGKIALVGVILLTVYRAFLAERVPVPLLAHPSAPRLVAGLFASAIIMVILSSLIPQIVHTGIWRSSNARWEKAGVWASKNTPPSAVFLLPVDTDKPPAWADPVSRSLALDVTGFVAVSGRSIWTNHKFGAAPMWVPGTFPLVRDRYNEVAALKTAEARLAYASKHGISYVATFCDPAVASKPVYQDGDLCIYAAPAANK